MVQGASRPFPRPPFLSPPQHPHRITYTYGPPMTHHAGPVAAAALIAATPVAFVTFLKGKSSPWVEASKQLQTACSYTERKHKGPGKL